MYYTTELYHHGILGQKWGIRRYQNEDGTLTAEGKKRYRTDSGFRNKYDKQIQKESELAKKRDVKNRGTLSDKDLIDKINRAKNETELKKVTAENIAPGKTFVNNVLTSIGNKVLTSVGSGVALYAAKVLGTKLGKVAKSKIKILEDSDFDPKEFGNAIFNGGPSKKK